MSDKNKDRYSTVRIPRDLADETDELIGTKGFTSRAEIVKEALRRLIQEYSRPPTFEYYNLTEKGVLILDRTMNRVVSVSFRDPFNPGVWCNSCQKEDCPHVRFALTKPEVQGVIRKRREEGVSE